MRKRFKLAKILKFQKPGTELEKLVICKEHFDVIRDGIEWNKEKMLQLAGKKIKIQGPN